MGRAMFSKSLIQLSVDGLGCGPSLLFDLGPNYGGGNEDNGDCLQKFHACTVACSAPTLQQATWTHASTRDSWTLTGKSEPVSCVITAPFSWVLVHTRFCLSPPRVFSQSFVRSVRIVITLLQCYIVTVLAGYQG